jgi:hypothetical protein
MQNIRREFFVFNTDQTLVLENPLSIQFINCYNGIGATQEGQVIINNTFVLTPYWKSLGFSGSAIIVPAFDSASPYFLNLENNLNEQDATQYTIKFFNNNPSNRLFVIVKYKRA